VALRCRRAAAWRRLLFCKKLGGQLPTLPTRHLRPLFKKKKNIFFGKHEKTALK
jgi:hypothetical protein